MNKLIRNECSETSSLTVVQTSYFSRWLKFSYTNICVSSLKHQGKSSYVRKKGWKDKTNRRNNVTFSALINSISVQLLYRSSMLNDDYASTIFRVIQWRATFSMRPKPDSWEKSLLWSQYLFVWATTRFSSWGDVKVLDIIPVCPCLLDLLFL